MLLINDDCLNAFKQIKDNSVDLIVTDPPYTMTKRGKSCRPNYMPDSMGDNLFDYELPDTKKWFSDCYRVLKDDTHFYTFCNTNDIGNYLKIAEEVGFKLHNIITMIKDTHMPNRWYMKYSELVLFFRKGDAKPIKDMRCRDYYYATMPTKKDSKFHITQKPLDFIEMMVNNSSDENDVVLDPFMGSGTTGIACKKLNRDFIGFEIDENHYKTAKERIENYNKKQLTNTLL